MAVATAEPRRRRVVRARAGQTERAVYGIGGLAIGVALVVLVASPSTLGMHRAWHGIGANWFGALVLYVVSHWLRVLRLAYLVVHPTVRTRRAVAIHWYCTGLAVLLPFKISEVVRIRQVGLLRSDWIDGVVIVWVERVLDAVALSILVTIALLAGSSAHGLTAFLVVSAVFVAATLIVATVLPSNARDVMLHLVRRNYGPRSLVALKSLRATISAVDRVPKIVGRKLPTLVLLTLGIWGAEAAALQVALRGVGLDIGSTAHTLLEALAGLSLHAVAITPDAGARLLGALPAAAAPSLDLYRTIVIGTALVGGAAAAAIGARNARPAPSGTTTS